MLTAKLFLVKKPPGALTNLAHFDLIFSLMLRMFLELELREAVADMRFPMMKVDHQEHIQESSMEGAQDVKGERRARCERGRTCQ